MYSNTFNLLEELFYFLFARILKQKHKRQFFHTYIHMSNCRTNNFLHSGQLLLYTAIQGLNQTMPAIIQHLSLKFYTSCD